MIKKAEKKFLDRLVEKQDKEANEVKAQISGFYADGVLAKIASSSGKEPFASIFPALRKDSTPQAFTEEQMIEKCFQIRNHVKEGKPGNIEINFAKMVQRSNGFDQYLRNTLVKVFAMDSDMPIYLHILKDDILTSLAFIGGDDAQAFLVTKDEHGNPSVIRLSEFHLLSISENSTPEKEVGLMTSYSWIGGKVYSCVIMGPNLDPVKNLLLSEGLRSMNNEGQNPTDVAKENTDG